MYAIEVFSVESIYYHPEIQKYIAPGITTTKDVNDVIAKAKESAIDAIKNNANHLIIRASEKTIRQTILNQLPTLDTLKNNSYKGVSLSSSDIENIISSEKNTLNKYLSNKELAKLITKYPIRETSALNSIAKNIGFHSRHVYEKAVIKGLTENGKLEDGNTVLDFIKSLLGDVVSNINSDKSLNKVSNETSTSPILSLANCL